MAYGFSPLNGVYYEMEQYLRSSIHNLSILQRAMKIGGIIKTANVLTDDRRTRLEQQVNAGIKGSSHAGRILVTDKDTEFQDTISSSRDMDYMQMRTQVTMAIYNALKIPLPLVSEQHMTLSNLVGAKAIFYEQAVLPLRRRIDQELNAFLMPRYEKNNQDLILTFNDHDISALEPMRNEQAKIQKEIGVFTINEIRKNFALEPLQGGGALYSTMQMPFAIDLNDKIGAPLESMDLGFSEIGKEPKEVNAEPETIDGKPSKKPSSAQNSQGNEFDNDYNENEELTDYNDTIMRDEEAKPLPTKNKSKYKTKKTLKKKVNEKKIKLAVPDRNLYIDKLKLQRNKDGSRRFTDEEITEFALELYGEEI